MRIAHLEAHLMPTITPNEAAIRTGRSRRTVMRAIEALELPAHRDNRNCWRIEEEALAHWARSERAHADAHSDDQLSPSVLIERIRGLELRLAELQEDRNQWRDQAQRLASTAPSTRSVSFLRRLLSPAA